MTSPSLAASEHQRRDRVLVLGASSGIGLAIAERLAIEPGLELTVTVPLQADVARVRASVGPEVSVEVVDLSADDARAAVDAVAPGHDVLVLSAGLEYVGPAQHEPEGAFADLLSVNAAGPGLAATSCLATMLQRGRGLIVALGSVTAAAPRPFLAAYAASKAAIEFYLLALADELVGTGVEIQNLRLGPVDTGLGSRGPANWSPDRSSPYHDGYLAARRAADQERDAAIRTPEDVADDVVRRILAFSA